MEMLAIKGESFALMMMIDITDQIILEDQLRQARDLELRRVAEDLASAADNVMNSRRDNSRRDRQTVNL
jgi:hypothetical protein